MKWAPGRRNGATGSIEGTSGRKVQPWQNSMPDANEGTRTGANVQPWQYSMPDAIEGTRQGAKKNKNGLQFVAARERLKTSV